MSNAPALSPRHLAELHAYAAARLAAGEGGHLLAAHGAQDPALLRANEAGYLPPDFPSALPRSTRRVLPAATPAEMLCLPARDPTGAIRDFWVLEHGWWLAAEPAPGLVGSALLGIHEELHLTDDWSACAACFAAGEQACCYLPDGAAAITAHADWWRASRVRRAVLLGVDDPDSWARGLHAVGIRARGAPTDAHAQDGELAVVVADALPPGEAPGERGVVAADPSPPEREVVEVDRPAQTALLRAGDRHYAVELPPPAAEDAHACAVQVTVRHRGKVCRDRFPLFEPAARRRFADVLAAEAAERGRLEEDLAWIADEVARLGAPPSTHLAEKVDPAIAALLRRADLLDVLAEDLATCGWVGDLATRRLAILTVCSRLTPRPVWVDLAGESPVRDPLGILAALTPPEAQLHASLLAPAALRHGDRDALRHRVLFLDQGAYLPKPFIVTLRVLRERQALAVGQSRRDPASGRWASTIESAQGPVALVAREAGQVGECCHPLALDASPDQVQRVLAVARAQVAGGGDAARCDTLIARHHAVQRALAPRPVVVPFAHRLRCPAEHVLCAADHEALLTLIQSHALLMQYQRAHDEEGAVIATPADFAAVQPLAAHLFAPIAAGLSRQAARLWAAVQDRAGFTLPELAAELPGWAPSSLRHAVKQLVAAGYLAAEGAPGRGRRARRYRRLVEPAPADAAGGAPVPAAPPITLASAEDETAAPRITPFPGAHRGPEAGPAAPRAGSAG